jgi:hypothetical protein
MRCDAGRVGHATGRAAALRGGGPGPPGDGLAARHAGRRRAPPPRLLPRDHNVAAYRARLHRNVVAPRRRRRASCRQTNEETPGNITVAVHDCARLCTVMLWQLYAP